MDYETKNYLGIGLEILGFFGIMGTNYLEERYNLHGIKNMAAVGISTGLFIWGFSLRDFAIDDAINDGFNQGVCEREETQRQAVNDLTRLCDDEYF